MNAGAGSPRQCPGARGSGARRSLRPGRPALLRARPIAESAGGSLPRGAADGEREAGAERAGSRRGARLQEACRSAYPAVVAAGVRRPVRRRRARRGDALCSRPTPSLMTPDRYLRRAARAARRVGLRAPRDACSRSRTTSPALCESMRWLIEARRARWREQRAFFERFVVSRRRAVLCCSAKRARLRASIGRSQHSPRLSSRWRRPRSKWMSCSLRSS